MELNDAWATIYASLIASCASAIVSIIVLFVTVKQNKKLQIVLQKDHTYRELMNSLAVLYVDRTVLVDSKFVSSLCGNGISVCTYLRDKDKEELKNLLNSCREIYQKSIKESDKWNKDIIEADYLKNAAALPNNKLEIRNNIDKIANTHLETFIMARGATKLMDTRIENVLKKLYKIDLNKKYNNTF